MLAYRKSLVLSDTIGDCIVLVIVVIFISSLLKLYIAYGKPQVLKTFIFGMFLFALSVAIYVLNDFFQLPWFIRNILLNVFYVAGALFAAFPLVSAMRKLFEQAKIDNLTNLYNRKFTQELMNREMERSQRNQLTFSLLFADLNNFKKLNDQMGHALGDIVLGQVAHELKVNVRASDIVSRWGGDEFLILLPQTNQAEAKCLAQRLSKAVSNLQVDKTDLSFSLSMGIVTYPDDGDRMANLLHLADERMYQNKTAG